MNRILFISSAWPLGRAFGGQIRAFNSASALAKLGAVSVLTVGQDAGDLESRRLTESSFEVHAPVMPQQTPNRSLSAKWNWAFAKDYMNVHGLSIPVPERNRVIALARAHDLVWVLNARTPNILGIWSWPNGHLDADDLPSTYQRALGKCSASAIARWKARLLSHLFRRRERLYRLRFQTVSVCSNEDRAYLRGGPETHVIPNGFRASETACARKISDDSPRLGFIGLYNYPPNREGVEWFLANCWPLIRQALPNARFRLVGEGTDALMSGVEGGIDGLGWVKDPAEEMATWSSMVVPIRVGGGTRIKIAEAFSRKCPVISTSLGAFGYDAKNGRQLRLADNPQAFAAACIDLIRRPAEAAAMADRAFGEFLEKWTWDAIAPRISAAAEDCLRRAQDLPAPAVCE